MALRQAIVVKFLGSTNFLGSRYKATSDAGSLTLDSDLALSDTENAYRAGMALAKKFGWDKYNDYYIGGLPGNGGGYVLVAVDKAEKKSAVVPPNKEDADAFFGYVYEYEEDWTNDDPRIRGRRALCAAYDLLRPLLEK
jgi:hypothetical protein